MPLASLQFMQSHFDRLDTSRPIIALHVGNFLGVSLAYLVHTLRRLHPDSRVVSIDPNLTHRGIPRTMETVLVLLNYFGLEDRVAILTGYSLEKNVSNQGEIVAGYDPVANWENERSCTHQLDLLNALAVGSISASWTGIMTVITSSESSIALGNFFAPADCWYLTTFRPPGQRSSPFSAR